MKKNNPRKLHAGKNRIDKDNYQRILNSDFKLDQTEKDISTDSSDTSTIENENPIKNKKYRKKRPKSAYKNIKKFIEKNIFKMVISIVIALFSWLLINTYNFNASLKVAETNISNIEKQVLNYKNNGIISNDEYKDIEKEISNIKLSYAKLENINKMETNYEVLKTSIEKDIEYLKTRMDKIEE